MTSSAGRLPWWAPAGAALLAILLYASSVGYGYALDDRAVILENDFTNRGLAGVLDHLTQDSSAGLRSGGKILDEGRYRPLSLITFAVEWQIAPKRPWVGHLGNVLLYGASAALLMLLAWRLTGGSLAWAAASTVLFVVHPIHTEVVANIKSRDELLLLLFLLLSLLALTRRAGAAFGARHGPGTPDTRGAGPAPGTAATRDTGPQPGTAAAREAEPGPGTRGVLLGLAAFVPALFTKETAAIFPVLFLAGLWTTRVPARAMMRVFLAASVLTAAFLAWRFHVVGHGEPSQDLLNDPYAGADAGAKFSTIAVVMLRYLGLLFWPARLSHDYGIWQIPLRSPSDPLVWLSVAAHVALVALAAYGLQRRRLYGFGLLVYFAGLLPVSNLVVNVGAPMADRFLYLPSLGFLLALADLGRAALAGLGRAALAGLGGAGLTRLAAADPSRRRVERVVIGVLAAAALAGTIRTVDRSRDWSSEEALFLAGVEASPNSVKAIKAAADVWIERGAREDDPERRRAHLDRSVELLRRAIEIYPGFADAHLDLGMAYRLRGESELAEPVWRRYLELRPESGLEATLARLLADSYCQEGDALAAVGDRAEALRRYEAALRIAPGHAGARRGLEREELRTSGDGH